ncbi:MAG TPA: tetratricopeptide repeat protein [Ferruginibacter sp.]|jgi:tetratricopeptide (TPR) repeat protein|nr:tetratricopeptide repeat protein [Chitinophagales bacterium]HMU71114.1 tetratricopeptide repeat protein [Ferruginibacter sp.]HMW25899.1 tetratricopeptide repeat protein [Ferruginibacter sp.]HNA01199.1 tetratricopeptide repeat protein [Ferruginibacter sp.]HNF01213.1 tetratricopeptide repeat protein [Ferruginibacter sp.]
MGKRILPAFVLLFFSTASIAQKPANARSFYLKGIQLRNQNKFVEAVAAFQKAIKLDKKMDSAYFEIGLIFSRTQFADSAVWYYGKAIAVNPKMDVAHIALGNLYRDVKNKPDSAIASYFNALKTDSLNKLTYYSIAWCYNAKGESEKAIPYAIKSLEIDNNYKPGYNELGYAYRTTGKYREAIEQFKKNIAISPVDIAMLYTAYCYIELKEKDGAMEQYEALKKVNEKMADGLKKKIDAMQ